MGKSVHFTRDKAGNFSTLSPTCTLEHPPLHLFFLPNHPIQSKKLPRKVQRLSLDIFQTLPSH